MSATDAIALAEAECRRLGVVPEAEWMGPAARRSRAVHLRDRTGRRVSSGGGKGTGEQCSASAVMEALEHLHLLRGLSTARSRPAEVQVLAAAEVAAQAALTGDVLLRRLAEEHPTSPLECLRYTADRSGATVWYPTFVKNPHCRQFPATGEGTAHRAYHRYSSGNGTAGGINAVEAILHGTLELVERDAVSLAYIDWYLNRTGPVRTIDLAGLPADVAALAEVVARVLGAPPLLIDITTDLGVPVVLALPPVSTEAAPMPGAGASLSGLYAVERALDELLQVIAAEGSSREERDNRVVRGRMLDRWPQLRAAYDLDPLVLRELGTETVPVPSSAEGGEVAGVACVDGPVGRLDRLTDLLAARGLDLFSAPWTPPESLVAVHSALVPGLDSFFMVQMGVPVLPTGRGARRAPAGAARGA